MKDSTRRIALLSATLVVLFGTFVVFDQRAEEGHAALALLELAEGAEEGESVELLGLEAGLAAEREPEQAAVHPAEVPAARAASSDSFWCRLICGDTGSPVIGASASPFHDVWGLSETGSSMGPSDRSGMLELPLKGGTRRVVQIEAEGYGSVLLQPPSGHVTAKDALEVRLGRCATLKLHLVSGDYRPLANASLAVSARRPPVLHAKGFTMILPKVTWRETSDEAGFCEFPNLPARTPMTLSLKIAGKAAQKYPTPIALPPAETRELEWRIGGEAELRGRLIDQDGRPVAHRKMWLIPATGEWEAKKERRYFYPSEHTKVALKTHTEAQGVFSFRNVKAGWWRVGPSARETKKSTAVAVVGTLIEIQPGNYVETIELRVQRGLYITGRVVTPDGGWPEYAHVSADSKLGSCSTKAKEGAFQLGPLEAGVYELGTMVFGDYQESGTGYIDSTPVEAMAGARDIELKLSVGGRVRAKFIDSRTGAECQVDSLFTCRENGGMVSLNFGTFASLDRSGLTPGIYSFSASTAEGLFGRLGGVAVESGALVDGLELRLEAGAKLRILYTGSEPRAHLEVYRGTELVACWPSMSSGTEEQIVVPAGSLQLRMLVKDKLVESRELWCAVGETVEATFVLE